MAAFFYWLFFGLSLFNCIRAVGLSQRQLIECQNNIQDCFDSLSLVLTDGLKAFNYRRL
jgi:hypothetical protein